MLYVCGMHWELFHLESLEPQGKNNAPAAVSNSCDFKVFFNFSFFHVAVKWNCVLWFSKYAGFYSVITKLEF